MIIDVISSELRCVINVSFFFSLSSFGYCVSLFFVSLSHLVPHFLCLVNFSFIIMIISSINLSLLKLGK